MKVRITYLLVFVLIAGCRTSINTQSQYVLNAERAQETPTSDAAGVLDVHRFTIDRTYDFKDLVYRKDSHKYEIDYYNGFLVSPSQMITERARNWLSRSSLFSRVLHPGSQAEPTHALEGHIVNLYGDYRAGQQAKAVMEVRFFLIDQEDRVGGVLLKETYAETQPLAAMDASDLVQAMDDCLMRILEALERDVAEALEQR